MTVKGKSIPDHFVSSLVHKQWNDTQPAKKTTEQSLVQLLVVQKMGNCRKKGCD